MALEPNRDVPAQQSCQLDIERNHHFHYPSINSVHEETRLVRIFPGNVPDPICAELTCTKASQEYTYTALSYRWGEGTQEDDVAPIVLNEQTFWVRKNLWGFLNRVRIDPLLHPRLFWIDAICINQSAGNNEEKTAQVSMMRRIYLKAHKVICWLGEPSSSRQSDLADLRTYLIRETTAEQERRALRGLAYLLDQPYWTRLWIVQEVVLAERVTLICGGFRYNWGGVLDLWDDYHEVPTLEEDDSTSHKQRAAMEHISKVSQKSLKHYSLPNTVPRTRSARTLESRLDFESLVNWGKAEKVIRLSRGYQRGANRQAQSLETSRIMASYPLLAWIRAFQDQECSNPLDRIYGMSGLFTDMYHDIGITPDYSKTLVVLYADVMRYLLEMKYRKVHELRASLYRRLLGENIRNGCGLARCTFFCIVQHYLGLRDEDVKQAWTILDEGPVQWFHERKKDSHPWISD